MKIYNKIVLTIFTVASFITGCKSFNGVQTATALGTTGGEAFGEMFGKASGNGEAGAVIGANLGEVTGAVIGSKMNRQVADIKSSVPKASVNRAGDKIAVEFNSKTLFKANRAELLASSEKDLSELAKIFKKYPDTFLEIHGHTDNKGLDHLNLSLSERRAISVATFFENKGISSNRITNKGLGSAFPKYRNDSDKGRMQNRRVEILISSSEK